MSDKSTPLDADFLRSFVCLRRSPQYEAFATAIRRAGITTAASLVETQSIERPAEIPRTIWTRLMRCRRLPPRSIWEHLNACLPEMPYDEEKIRIQKKSGTEYAVGSHTPLDVKLWSDFDNEIRQAAVALDSLDLVRADLGIQLSSIDDDPGEKGISLVIEEEDVTQNACRILTHAADLLKLEFIAGNKDLSANPDTTVSVPAIVTSTDPRPKQTRAQIMASNKERVRFPVETNPQWKYDFLSEDTQACIINEWEVVTPPLPTSWSPQKRKVFHLLRQVYGQMKEDDLAIMTLALRCSIERKVNGSIRKHSSSPILKPPAKRRKQKDDDNHDKANDQAEARGKDRQRETKPSTTSPAARLSAANIDLWDCTHLGSTDFTKTFTTKCNRAFVKVVIDPRMEQKVKETENEAHIYAYMLEKGISEDAVPAYFGCSDHRGTPLLCLGMEGQDFEEIGLEKITSSLKKSAIESIEAVSRIGVWHGDLALRNIVQSKADPNQAKIVDFGRAKVIDDREMLEGQVRDLEKILGIVSAALVDAVEAVGLPHADVGIPAI